MENNTKTIVVDDNIVISHLTGYLATSDIDTWYEEFEKTCFGFIHGNRPFRLLMNRDPYTVSDNRVRKYWREKFFNDTITSSYKASCTGCFFCVILAIILHRTHFFILNYRICVCRNIDDFDIPTIDHNFCCS